MRSLFIMLLIFGTVAYMDYTAINQPAQPKKVDTNKTTKVVKQEQKKVAKVKKKYLLQKL